MKPLFPSILLLALVVGCTEGDAPECDLVGTWAVDTLIITGPDGVATTAINPPAMKIFSETHFVFVEQSENPDDPTSGGGGSYRVEGNRYIENVEIHNATDFVGMELPFDCRMSADGDKWYQIGSLPGGSTLWEAYRRK